MSDDAPAEAEDATDEAADTAEEEETAYGCPVVEVGSQQVLFPAREQWLEVAGALLADGWNMCVDVTSVDYLNHGGRALPASVEAERFEVVASFVSYGRKARLRARIQVPADDPTVDSLYALYPGTDFLEREVYDLMGITFTGHPDLSRILMPEDWEGHPLRKDFSHRLHPRPIQGSERGVTMTGDPRPSRPKANSTSCPASTPCCACRRWRRRLPSTVSASRARTTRPCWSTWGLSTPRPMGCYGSCWSSTARPCAAPSP